MPVRPQSQAARSSASDISTPSPGQFIDAAVEGLRAGQVGKPLSPMIADIIIDATVRGMALEMPEDVRSSSVECGPL